MDITRRIEFDAGHRIPDHASKCRSVHGHRYVLEATLRGAVNPTRGESDDGMVVDFGNLKAIMQECIGDKWDHATLVASTDGEFRAALSSIEGNKTVVVPFIPTVENMAAHAFQCISDAVASPTIWLEHVRLYETPNCWADVYAPTE